jgi:hypothetical protein
MLTLEPKGEYTHPLDSLNVLTGTALFGYDLKKGEKYRVIAVYRPGGPNGPGFTSREVVVE